MNYGLDEILKLNPKKYNYIIDDSESIGFIAQEMERIIPEIVSGKEGNKGIGYGQLSAVLVNAIKELKMENDQLKVSNGQMQSAYILLKQEMLELKGMVQLGIKNW